MNATSGPVHGASFFLKSGNFGKNGLPTFSEGLGVNDLATLFSKEYKINME